MADWSEDLPYDEEPPTCIHYSIEWKLTINGKGVSKDTEQDLVLAPGAFWRTSLRLKLEKVLHKKTTLNRSFKADDTNITVSVTDRSQRDLVKCFDELAIYWTVVEKQLHAWSHLFAIGKKLRIDMSFNYVETGQAGTALVRGTKRGYTSVSQQMLSERTMLLDAEETSSGQPSTWRSVYNLMHCPGPPCHLGPYCWRDDVGKRHYRLKTHHLRKLIHFVDQGGQLESHGDLPEAIRDQLYAEEQQDVERRRKRRATSPTGCPPIHITNVLPQGPAVSPGLTATPAEAGLSMSPTRSVRLEIAGPRDVAVRAYSAWQSSQVNDRALKIEYQKACAITLDEGLDLELVHEDQDADLYIWKGVRRVLLSRLPVSEWSASLHPAAHSAN